MYEEAAPAADDAETRQKTPRSLPNIWPDLRPKVKLGLKTDDEEYMYNLSSEFNEGDRVIVNTAGALGARRGEVMFVGKTGIAPGYWVGVQYDEMVGKNDGSYNGERFFTCPVDYGGFVRPNACKTDWRPPPANSAAAAAAAAKLAAEEAAMAKAIAPPKVKRKNKRGSISAAAAANPTDQQLDPASDALADVPAPAPAPESASPGAEPRSRSDRRSRDSKADGGTSPDRTDRRSRDSKGAEGAPAVDSKRSERRSRESRRSRDSKGSGGRSADAEDAGAAAIAAAADAAIEAAALIEPVIVETKALVKHDTAAVDEVTDMMERALINPREAWIEHLPTATRRLAIEHMASMQKLSLNEARRRYDATQRGPPKTSEPVKDAATRELHRKAAAASSAVGAGLTQSIVRQLGVFTITVCDENGNRREVGGEQVAVAVRGTSNVRARLTDNNDGTYTCRYRAWVSGSYSIGVWINTEALGGSPFPMQVLSTRADPEKCELRGEGLKRATSRDNTSFEVEFVDAFGQVCYAEELDVYVELVYSPRTGFVATSKPNFMLDSGYLTREPGAKPLLPPTEDDTTVDADIAPKSALMMARRRSHVVLPQGTPLHMQEGDVAISLLPPERRPVGWVPPADMVARYEEAGEKAEATPEEVPAASPNARSREVLRAVEEKEPSETASSASPPISPAARPDEEGRLTIESFLAQGGGEELPPEGGLRAKRTSLMPVHLESLLAAAPKPPEYARIDAVERQQHMQLWTRRNTTDRAQVAAVVRRDKKMQSYANSSNDMPVRERERESDLRNAALAGQNYQHELKGDRKGFGFAYGGVSPGTLHAKGQLVRVHTVSYSIGLAGKYRLHVGLRQQAVGLPGSPFDIEVVPGGAYAPSTRLPMEQLPLRGVVGDKWRGMVIFAADKIGNQCVKGGAKVKISSDPDVEANCSDNGDGSYAFQWRSERSGTYAVNVTIDGIAVLGSPTSLTMLAAGLEVNNCEIAGTGLTKAVAGEPAVLKIKIRDQYGNGATPSTALKFILSLQTESTNENAREKRKKEKEKAAELRRQEEEEFGRLSQAQRLEQQRSQTPGGVPDTSTAKKAKQKATGENKDDEKERRKKQKMEAEIPAMEFEGQWVDGEYEIRYTANKAGAHLLYLWADPEGRNMREPLPGAPFEVVVAEAQASPASSSIGYPQEEKKPIHAGEKLTLRPQLRDKFGNPASASDEIKITALLEAPDGPKDLEVKASNKGIGAYEVTHESELKGEYTLHIHLGGMPIGGSPGVFVVEPAQAYPAKSKLHPPTEVTLTHRPVQLILETADKLGNLLERGGAKVDARIIGPNAGQLTTEDLKDGKYCLTFSASSVGEYRVIARLDNVEMPPVTMMFGEGRAGKSDSSLGGDDRKGRRRKSVTKGGGEEGDAEGSPSASPMPGRDSVAETSPSASNSMTSASASASAGRRPSVSATASFGGGSVSAKGSCSAMSAMGSCSAVSATGSAGAKKGPTKPLALGKALASGSSSIGSGGQLSERKTAAPSHRAGAATTRAGGESSRGGASTNRVTGASTTRAGGAKVTSVAAKPTSPDSKSNKVKFTGKKA